MKFKVIVISFICLLFSCCFSPNYKKSELEKYTLNYKNGNKYCEGTYLVYKKGEKTKKYKNGIWKFYTIEGNPEKIEEYDFDDLINYKEFNEKGKIIVSKIISDKTTTFSRFYENGNIKYESVTEYETDEDYEVDEDGTHYYNTEYSYKTIKTYHKNGQLKSLRNDEGITKIWDNLGNLILEF